jgi:hypothetical protein
MQFCHEVGLAHSVFLEWEPEDRGKMMAFILEKGERCHLCGTSQREWDPERGGKKTAYEPVSVFCPGCYAKTAVSDDTSSQPGVTIELRPTGTQESAQRYVLQKRRDAARRIKKRRV